MRKDQQLADGKKKSQEVVESGQKYQRKNWARRLGSSFCPICQTWLNSYGHYGLKSGRGGQILAQVFRFISIISKGQTVSPLEIDLSMGTKKNE